MNNSLLGKTLKIMYKQSGKTISQLSDETGLSVDTINNLFYARVQKPGLTDVELLTNAMGFSLIELMTFTSQKFPPDADLAVEFARFTLAEGDSSEALHSGQSSKEFSLEEQTEKQLQDMKMEHEKQLDRFRATHLLYVEQIQNQYKAQLADMEKLMQNDKALKISRMTNRILGIAVFFETIGLVILALFHV